MREREGRRGENEGGRCGGTLGKDEVGMDGFPSRTMGVSEVGRAAGGRVGARTESFWVLCCPITVMVLNTLRLSLPLCLVRSQEGRHVAPWIGGACIFKAPEAASSPWEASC